MGQYQKCFNIEGREKEHCRKIFKEVMLNNCLQIMNEVKPQIHEAQKTPQKVNNNQIPHLNILARQMVAPKDTGFSPSPPAESWRTVASP